MVKFMEKFPFFSAFFTLLFLYHFCQILCFVVEDHFGELLFTRPHCLIEADYWKIVVSMFCTGTLALIFHRATLRYSIGRFLTQILFGALAIAVTSQIAQNLQNFFYASNTWADFWTFLINIMAISLYALIGFLAEKRFESGEKKYSFITAGIFAICFATAFCCSAHYMPREIMKTIKQDTETAKAVKDAVFNIKQDIPVKDLPESVQIKEEKGKKIISWKFVTDFEALKKDGKLTKRVKDKLAFEDGLIGIRDISVSFEYNNEQQEITVDLPEKK